MTSVKKNIKFKVNDDLSFQRRRFVPIGRKGPKLFAIFHLIGKVSVFCPFIWSNLLDLRKWDFFGVRPP